jgi:hypothetical protein
MKFFDFLFAYLAIYLLLARMTHERRRKKTHPNFDFARPAAQDFARPAAQDFARPAAQDFARPAAQDFARPAAQDFARPAAQDAHKTMWATQLDFVSFRFTVRANTAHVCRASKWGDD